MTDVKIKAVFSTPVERKNRSKDIKFSDRDCFHKCGRIIYKVFRSIFVSYFFYMVPFTEILLSFFAGFPYKYQDSREIPAPDDPPANVTIPA
jgi:hypothetical protein